jgi:hypothetical protein
MGHTISAALYRNTCVRVRVCVCVCVCVCVRVCACVCVYRSHNFSGAAWGSFEEKDFVVMSYELSVLMCKTLREEKEGERRESERAGERVRARVSFES